MNIRESLFKALDNLSEAAEVTMKQLQKKFNDGTHEAMNDPKPGYHVELRNTKTGKRTTHYVKEEVELDEAKSDVYHQHMLKALGKTRLPKDHPYTSAIANNGDFVVHKSGNVVGRIPKGEHKLGESVELDEVSKQTLGSYIKKAVSSSAALRAKADLLGKRALDTDNTANSEKYFDASDKAYKKHMNRISGTAKAVDRLTKEEVELDEVSKSTLVNYMDKSKSEVKGLQKKYNAGKLTPDEDKKFDRRLSGQNTAMNKFHGRAKVPASGVDKAYDATQKALRKEETDSSSKDATVKSTKANVTKDTTATTPYDVKPLRVKMAQFRKLF